MNGGVNRTIVVTGATGLQGSAVTRHLLADGWQVRALTRKPKSEKARALSARGAEVVEGDMTEPASLTPAFDGAYGIFSVQNPVTSGIEGEISQGKNVAVVARHAGVQHLVYASAGTGARGTGVPSWESKLVIEDFMKSLELPLTIVRPMAFMELMTEKKFFPAVSTWHIMPKVMGSARKVVWLSVEDLGYIVAQVFANSEQYIGQELRLASDVKSMDEARDIYQAVTGKRPPRFPLPVGLFRRFGFVGKDLMTMWRWLRDATFDLDTATARTIHPQAMTVQQWLEKQNDTNRKE